MEPPFRQDELAVADRSPRPQLVTEETLVATLRFAVVDAHLHLSSSF